MRQIQRITCGTLALVMLAAESKAQMSPAQENVQSSGWNLGDLDQPVSDQLGFPKWIRLGGQYRGRLEDDTALSFVPGATDTYYLERIRVNMTVLPTSWLLFSADFQDSHNFLYGRPPAPLTSDPFDLHQAYLQVGKREGTGFHLKVGRQEMIIGSQRLVGSGDWLNSGHSHDAIRADYTDVKAGLKVDVVAGSQVLIDANRFDRHIPGEHWYTVYTTAKKWIPNASVEPYYFLKTTWNTKGEHGGLGDTYVHTLGGRIIGTGPGKTDYSVEVAKQVGHYATDPIRALAGAYILGWKMSSAEWKPRLSVEYDHASGDTNPKDGVRETFDNMYCGHGYYGFADQLGWRNMRSARAGFDFSASKKLQFRFDALNDFLYTTQDALYNVGGTVKVLDRKATSNHIGEEADFLVIFQLSRNTQFKTGFNHIFPGAYLKQATKGSGYSTPFIMWTKNF